MTGGVSLQSQSDKEIVLTYDGTTLTETITDLSTSATFSTSYLDLDIPQFVGADTAYVGLTGATGANWTLHDVLTWTYDEQEGKDLPPRRPARVRVASVDRADAGHSNITSAWLCNAYAGITGFAIERSSDGADFTEIARVDAIALSYTDPALAGGTYSYRLRSFNTKRASAPSNVDSILMGGGDIPTVVDHSAGFGSHDDITNNGNGVYVGNNARLTEDPGHGMAGSFFLNDRLPIKSFSSTFTFQINPAGADGMTFTMQGNQPTAVGLRGNGLGYEAIQNSVAIKFDIYDHGAGPNATGLFTDGRRPSVRAPGLPLDVPDVAVSLDGSGVSLRGLHVLRFDMVYDGAVLAATITDTSTMANASQYYVVDLPRFLGGNFAYLGWTGGTGGISATQDVLTWSFQAP